MSALNIEKLIHDDLDYLLTKKSEQGELTLHKVIEVAAYVAAKYLRIIYTKNKEIKPEELNGVFGIISNFYSEIFNNELHDNEYQKISSTALDLLQDTNFDNNCKEYFAS